MNQMNTAGIGSAINVFRNRDLPLNSSEVEDAGYLHLLEFRRGLSNPDDEKGGISRPSDFALLNSSDYKRDRGKRRADPRFLP